MVRVGKVLNPLHHIPLREVIAITAIALGNEESENVRIKYLALASGKNTIEVNSSRERYPIARPYATVCQEESGLDRARGLGRARKVVRAAYDIVVGRASIVDAE